MESIISKSFVSSSSSSKLVDMTMKEKNVHHYYHNNNNSENMKTFRNNEIRNDFDRHGNQNNTNINDRKIQSSDNDDDYHQHYPHYNDNNDMCSKDVVWNLLSPLFTTTTSATPAAASSSSSPKTTDDDDKNDWKWKPKQQKVDPDCCSPATATTTTTTTTTTTMKRITTRQDQMEYIQETMTKTRIIQTRKQQHQPKHIRKEKENEQQITGLSFWQQQEMATILLSLEEYKQLQVQQQLQEKQQQQQQLNQQQPNDAIKNHSLLFQPLSKDDNNDDDDDKFHLNEWAASDSASAWNAFDLDTTGRVNASDNIVIGTEIEDYDYTSVILKWCGIRASFVSVIQLLKQQQQQQQQQKQPTKIKTTDQKSEICQNITLSLTLKCLEQILGKIMTITKRKNKKHYTETTANTATKTTKIRQKEEAEEEEYEEYEEDKVETDEEDFMIVDFLLFLFCQENDLNHKEMKEHNKHPTTTTTITTTMTTNDNILVRIPQLVANACYNTTIDIPYWATHHYYYKHLVSGLVSTIVQLLIQQQQLTSNGNSSHSSHVSSSISSNNKIRTNQNNINKNKNNNNNQLDVKTTSTKLLDCFGNFVQHMIRHRGGEEIALGLYHYYYHSKCISNASIHNNIQQQKQEKKIKMEEEDTHITNTEQQYQHESETTILVPFFQLIMKHTFRQKLLPRETAILIRSILRYNIAEYTKHQESYTKQLHNNKSNNNSSRRTIMMMMIDFWIDQIIIECSDLQLKTSKSIMISDALIHLVVLSSSSIVLVRNQNQNQQQQQKRSTMVDYKLCYLMAVLLLRSGQRQYNNNNNSNNKGQKAKNCSSHSNNGDSNNDSEDEDYDDSDSEDDKQEYEKDPAKIGPSFLLRRYMTKVGLTWSQSTFLQQTDYKLQRHVTYFLCSGLAILEQQQDDEDDYDKEELVVSDMVSNLLAGVTVRLHSSIDTLRTDGMWVGESLAQLLGQKLKFEELETNPQRQLPVLNFLLQSMDDNSLHDETTTTSPRCIEKLEPENKAKNRSKRHRTKTSSLSRFSHTDPNASCVKEADEDQNSSCSSNVGDNSSCNGESFHDDDSVWSYDGDDENKKFDRRNYDLEDDEQDLLETPRPLYLGDCLDLIRTPEGDDSACSRHLTGLQELPKLVRARPTDLADTAAEISIQVLRMENKFSIDGFSDLVSNALGTLAVEEPVIVGNTLIEEFFQDGSLSDRLHVLHALSEAAFELCGNKQLEEKARQVPCISGPRVSGKNSLMHASYEGRHYDVESLTASLKGEGSRTRRWGRLRANTSPTTVSNGFIHIAPIWFYSLAGHFMEHKDESRMWGGEIGATLLANLLITLSYMVECSGPYHHSSETLAKDLLQFAWPFCTAEIAEVRASVMFAVGSSLSILREDHVLGLLFGNFSLDRNMSSAIEKIASTDPDENCRNLAGLVLNKIIFSLKQIRSPITVIK